LPGCHIATAAVRGTVLRMLQTSQRDQRGTQLERDKPLLVSFQPVDRGLRRAASGPDTGFGPACVNQGPDSVSRAWKIHATTLFLK